MGVLKIGRHRDPSSGNVIVTTPRCLDARSSTKRGLSACGRRGGSRSERSITSRRALKAWLASLPARSDGNTLFGLFRTAEYSGNSLRVLLPLSQSNTSHYLPRLAARCGSNSSQIDATGINEPSESDSLSSLLDVRLSWCLPRFTLAAGV